MNEAMGFKEKQREYGFDTGRIEKLKQAVETVARLNAGTVSLVNLKAHLSLS